MHVMKKILYFFLVSLFAVTVQAQTAKSFFVNMPDSLSPLLTKVNRADFADFLESKMKAAVKNKFDENAEMKTLTKDYIYLQDALGCSTQFKVLPVNDSVNVVCVVNTVCGEACDSDLKFYSADYSTANLNSYITLPSVNDFLVAPSDASKQDDFIIARNMIDINLMEAKLSPDNASLIFRSTLLDYLDEASAKLLKPFLRSEIVYDWEGGRFVKQ